MIRRYRETRQKEKDYNLYWRAKGYYVRPQALPFFFRWLAGFTRELEPEHQAELEQNRREYELELQSRYN